MIGLRVRRGDIQTAIHIFQRAEDRRTIRLVGTQHFGEPDYFSQLRKAIDAAEAGGAVVHYEGVTGCDEDAAAAARSDVERQAVQTYRNRREARLLIPTKVGLNWITQNDGLPMAPSWRNIDVAHIDVMRLLGRAASRPAPFLSRFVAELARRASDQNPKDLRMLHRVYFYGLARDTRKRRRGVADPARADVIGTWRVCHATAAALAEERDVVMVWGAGHVKDIGEILQRNDFELIETHWQTATHKPRRTARGSKQPG